MSTTRSTTSTLLPDPADGAACARGADLDGGRHRGATHSRRLDADLVGSSRSLASRWHPSVARVLADEAAAGLDTVEGHDGFARQVAHRANDFVEFLVGCQRTGMRVAGYGAPGKGNTLLNHCGIRSDLMEFTVDRNPHKHGMFLPGTHIPIHPVERLARGATGLCGDHAVEPAR